jgi:hypothetical protein
VKSEERGRQGRSVDCGGKISQRVHAKKYVRFVLESDATTVFNES